MRSDLQPLVLKPADYSPDMPSFQNPGSGNILNCVPRTPQSYGPFAGLNTFGGALDGTCLGAFACADSAGNNYVFAGTADKLYDYVSSSTTPNNISLSGGYTIPSGERWKFLLFGQRVLATSIDAPLQSYLLQSSSAFSSVANGGITSLTLVAGSGYTPGTYALSVTGSGSGFAGTVTVNSGGSLASYVITSFGTLYPQTATIAIPAGAGAGTGGSITPTIQTIAPQGRYIDAVRGFCVVANTYDSVGGNQPQRVWWSALNDPTDWPTPGTNTSAQFQSSYNDLFGNGGWNMGIVGNLGTADGAIFQERQVWRMMYVGPPDVFDFVPAEGVRGTPAPSSLVHLGPMVYYLGQDGFYAFDGTNSTPIGVNRVDKTFYSIVDQTNMHRIDGCADPINKIVYWAFPTVGGNGNPDHILAYNWQLDKWAMISGVTVETIFQSLTFGYTLDALNAFGTLDSLQFPFDSRAWTGGNLLLSAFNASHQLSYFNGSNLQATIDTTEIQPFPGSMAFVQNVRPLVDGGLPTVSMAARNRLIDPSAFGAATTINAIGTCPQNINGRYLKAETIIPAGATWTHYQGVEVEGIPNGVM